MATSTLFPATRNREVFPSDPLATYCKEAVSAANALTDQVEFHLALKHVFATVTKMSEGYNVRHSVFTEYIIHDYLLCITTVFKAQLSNEMYAVTKHLFTQYKNEVNRTEDGTHIMSQMRKFVTGACSKQTDFVINTAKLMYHQVRKTTKFIAEYFLELEQFLLHFAITTDHYMFRALSVLVGKMHMGVMREAVPSELVNLKQLMAVYLVACPEKQPFDRDAYISQAVYHLQDVATCTDEEFQATCQLAGKWFITRVGTCPVDDAACVDATFALYNLLRTTVGGEVITAYTNTLLSKTVWSNHLAATWKPVANLKLNTKYTHYLFSVVSTELHHAMFGVGTAAIIVDIMLQFGKLRVMEVDQHFIPFLQKQLHLFDEATRATLSAFV